MIDRKPKILFCNPPGDKIYIRDYYCSKVSKAYYLPQPVDLLIQTSFFDEAEFELKVIDAIVEKLNFEECLDAISDFNPDLIIAQCGSVSWQSDQVFFKKLKERLPESKLLCSGDALLEDPKTKCDRFSWLDGVITDFFKPGPLQYFNGEPVNSGLIHKENRTSQIKRVSKKQVSLNVPKHHLFRNEAYRMPFMTGKPMATVLTNYACPFPCTFCIMSTLEFKSRTAESIIEELKSLKKIGVKFIYFSDQTFYMVPQVMDEVLDFMINEKLDIPWMCFSRVDVTTGERLDKMKAAGCKVIMYGVEWAEDKLLVEYKKQYNVDQIREAFELSKRKGIKRVGTFLIGVPGQSKESILNTINFAKEIEADYASFNVAVPRANTSFRKEALERDLITSDQEIMDQSGSFVTMGTGVLSLQEVEELKRKAYRSFYLRPGYIWQRMRSLNSWEEFKSHINEGYYVLKGIFAN